jgi:hypothetical protein
MSCPHGCGDAEWCSQCVGAVPRIVTRDPDTGILAVDGVPAPRTYQPATSPKYQTSKKFQVAEGKRKVAKAARASSARQTDDDVVDTDE